MPLTFGIGPGLWADGPPTAASSLDAADLLVLGDEPLVLDGDNLTLETN